MKIIFSRKGFDSSNGGYPSPIFPNSKMLSLPIPTTKSLTTIGELNTAGIRVGKAVEELTNDKISSSQPIHLDPDLDSHTLPRKPGWQPAFGQVKGAQSHLVRQGIRRGDLFLFFGWFRETEFLDNGKLRFKPTAPDLHVIFGWLEIADVLRVGKNIKTYAEHG